MKKQKTKNIKLAAVLLAVAAVVITVSVSVHFMPEIKNAVALLTRNEDKKPELSAVTGESVGVKTYSFDELKADENVEFDRSLMLINKKHRLTDGFEPILTDINNSGVKLDVKFAEAYISLKKAVYDNCNDNLYIMSSFRSAEEQARIKKSEGDTAAAVGASEHQSGLAADVYVMYHAGAGFLDSEAGKFVNENCKEYGFIIRYPDYGVKSTGISFEPWHIRFVGLPHSDIIASQKLTLEQYVEGLETGVFYSYGEYVITRQSGENGLTVPASFLHCTVSPDNTGNYICTVKVK